MNTIQTYSLNFNQLLRQHLMLSAIAILLTAFSIFASTSANAGWKGGYHVCEDTHITDVSDLSITEGAAVLELTTLASVLPPDIAELLDSSEDITVFAPTDEAFAKIPEAVLNAIASDETILKTVLSYHVSPQRVDPRKIYHPRKVDTLAGQDLFLSVSMDGPKVNQSNIDCQGYRTRNGLVWLIDSVLLPQF
jgi:uncharacterized surface protein with fasciclin (FAS1) repeats